MPVAVGELYGMVWEGVGSARGRPQAGRTSESWREIVRVVCHEAELERGTHGGKKTKRKARRRREKEREGDGKEEGTNRGIRKAERWGSYVSTYGKGYHERESERERTRIEQELDPQPVRNKRSFI